MFRQLSFDTSNSDVHIALVEDGTPLSERVISVKDATAATARQEAANLLIPGIDRMMSDAGWKRTSLDCIIVGTGPGGFTGIRTAVVTARALSQALRLPLYPVSILECISSALPGTFTIALYATMGYFYLAKGSSENIVSAYVSQSDVAKFVENHPTIYADERALGEFNGSSPALSQLAAKELPQMTNIAVQQAKFAWPRVSLKVNAICERLGQSGVYNGTDRPLRQDKLHAELCREFPYDVVVPTYLRAPSVTLKKTNV